MAKSNVLQPFACEVEQKTREIAANSAECAPEIGGFAMGVMENYG